MNTRIKELTDKINELKTQMREEGKVVLKETFKEFFEKYPQIEAVTWTQYTPYFNDGEPCEFSVGDFWCLSKESYDEYKEEGGYAEEYDIFQLDWDWQQPLLEDGSRDFRFERPYKTVPNMTPEQIKQCREDLRQIFSLPDEVFLDLFEDHSSIVATREGFDVEEYCHD